MSALLLAWALNWLALIPWRRSIGQHWTERARLLYPAVYSAQACGTCFGLSAAFALRVAGGEWARCWAEGMVAAWLGGKLAMYALSREVWPELTLKRWLRKFVIQLTFQFSGFWFVFLCAIIFMPPEFGLTAVLIGLAVGIFLLAMIFGCPQAVFKRLRLWTPAPEHQRALAQRAVMALQAELRGVWFCEGPAAYAAAFMISHDFVFSETLAKILSDEEFYAICLHEATHLTESRWTIAGRVVTGLRIWPFIFVRPAFTAGGPGGLLPLVVLFWLLNVTGRKLGRRMEVRADAQAAKQSPSPQVYARALEKFYEHNKTPAVMRAKSSRVHPDLYDRLLAVGIQPAYPRPAVPRRVNVIFIGQFVAMLAIEFSWFIVEGVKLIEGIVKSIK